MIGHDPFWPVFISGMVVGCLVVMFVVGLICICKDSVITFDKDARDSAKHSKEARDEHHE